MAEEEKNIPQTQNLEAGTYEIIQSRLSKQKTELINRLNSLNDSRKDVFGAIETELVSNDRINTDNNCIAADIIALDDVCIFGYNVHFGLRQEIELSDVFSIYSFKNHHFTQSSLAFIEDEQFVSDFKDLYKYYRNTVFSKFSILGNYLYMVFQISENPEDIKTFKWLIEDDRIVYIDNRSEHEFKYPPQHEFRWEKVSRDSFRHGEHAHVSILDKVFVEAIGGDLTIKIEDNTSDGLGIYREPVQHQDQTLDDGEYYYSDLGNLILIKIKPFQEDFRYFIFNNKIQEVVKVDALADAGILLPDSQGILFSNGYYLQTGEYNIFDKTIENAKFSKRISSPNGEDHLFKFYQQEKGVYLMLMYNVISQKISTPIICSGQTVFPNGELCYFTAEEKASKHHVVQIWQTPFTKELVLNQEHKDNLLFKIGNKDIVKAMAECQELIVLLEKQDSYAGLYQDITKQSKDIIDAYYWINDEAAFALKEPLKEIRTTAENAIEEFDKVVRIKAETNKALDEEKKNATALFDKIKFTRFEKIDEFVFLLSELRAQTGRIISLKELRYTDLVLIEKLEAETREQVAKLSEACVQFLVKDKALEPYKKRIQEKEGKIDAVQKVIEGKKLLEDFDQVGKDLELLIEIVGNLKIEDTSLSTKIIDDISLIFSTLNQVKAKLKNKISSLGSVEANAQFFAQLKLIDQSIVSYLDLSDTVPKCDDYLAKIMLQLEELQGKFAENEDFLEKITEKQENIYEAFESRKNQILDARNKKVTNISSSSERILKSIQSKLKQLDSVDKINAYYASDILIDKVRENVKQLFELEDSGKAESLATALKSAREDAIRQLRDKQDLFEGENTIKFGKYRFATNQQVLDLSILKKEDGFYFHLLGTDYFEKIKNDILDQNETLWEQELVSENDEVSRAEYLANLVFQKAVKSEDKKLDLVALSTEIAKERYSDAYTKGVHDVDAAKIAAVLLHKYQEAEILAYASKYRICALLAWYNLNEEKRDAFDQKIKAAGMIQSVFPEAADYQHLLLQLKQPIQAFNQEFKIFDIQQESEYMMAAKYLYEEFLTDNFWSMSESAVKMYKSFTKFLVSKKKVDAFETSLKQTLHIADKYVLAKHWLKSYTENQNATDYFIAEEVCFVMLKGLPESKKSIAFEATAKLENLLSNHPLIQDGIYHFDYYNFIEKLNNYSQSVVPAFEAFKEQKSALIEGYKQKLRLHEFKPRVLSSFVRNQLIDKVYLNIIGDNLAKQIGESGDAKRTDRQGLLLLISPPGYGKTTLMEYICNRLGLVFVKINGPAIGHDIVSLDPNEAKNAAAKQELQKLNFGLEMGNNIMLYLDDIQHCNPEFLQKFISLTDAQRKIEGIYNDVPKTYDLRGKKVCVVMAGNPYTESGDKFRVPDMLANRADIYNLGDVIGDSADLFKLSMIENALTSNVLLQKLVSKSPEDVYTILDMVESKNEENVSLKASHTKDELKEYKNIFEKIVYIRDIVLKVNQQYIKSAATADQFRTEPAFKLQGSYRDMNKMIGKIQSIMNPEELATIVFSHYKSESQTLTSGAEANMLKFKELIGTLNEAEAKRWEAIKATFIKNNKAKHLGNNQSQVLMQQLNKLSEHLGSIKDAIEEK